MASQLIRRTSRQRWLSVRAKHQLRQLGDVRRDLRRTTIAQDLIAVLIRANKKLRPAALFDD